MKYANIQSAVEIVRQHILTRADTTDAKVCIQKLVDEDPDQTALALQSSLETCLEAVDTLRGFHLSTLNDAEAKLKSHISSMELLHAAELDAEKSKTRAALAKIEANAAEHQTKLAALDRRLDDYRALVGRIHNIATER